MRNSQIRPIESLPRFKCISPTDHESAEDAEPEERFISRRSLAINEGTCNPFCHDHLRNLPFFRNRNQTFVSELLEDVAAEIFNPGEIIMREGAYGDSMYILNHGTVDIVLQEKVVAQLSDGAIFGEIALLGISKVRSATVRASTLCDCRVLHQWLFKRILIKFPEEKAYYEQEAHQRLLELNKKKESSNPRDRHSLSPAERSRNLAEKLRQRRKSFDGSRSLSPKGLPPMRRSCDVELLNSPKILPQFLQRRRSAGDALPRPSKITSPLPSLTSLEMVEADSRSRNQLSKSPPPSQSSVLPATEEMKLQAEERKLDMDAGQLVLDDDSLD